MIDKNKSYWWGTYRKMYRGVGCSMGFARQNRLNKPIFHAWSALNQATYCIILCYGWWTYRLYIKMPKWLVKAMTWYQLRQESKRKAP